MPPAFVVPKFFSCTIIFWLEREPHVGGGKMSAVCQVDLDVLLAFYSERLETARSPAAYYCYLLKKQVSSACFLLFVFFRLRIITSDNCYWTFIPRCGGLFTGSSRAECAASLTLNSLFKFILAFLFFFFFMFFPFALCEPVGICWMSPFTVPGIYLFCPK